MMLYASDSKVRTYVQVRSVSNLLTMIVDV